MWKTGGGGEPQHRKRTNSIFLEFIFQAFKHRYPNETAYYSLELGHAQQITWWPKKSKNRSDRCSALFLFAQKFMLDLQYISLSIYIYK